MDAIRVLGQVAPPAVIEDEAMGQKAIELLKLRRRILEDEYELKAQEAFRARFYAERAQIEARLEAEPDLAAPDRSHLRARLMEIDAKVWKSQQLSVQYRLELQTYFQLLRP